MKKTIIMCALMVLTAINANAQDREKSEFTYDESGNIQSVAFSKLDKKYEYVKSADIFFKDILKVKDDNHFVRKELRVEKKNEAFEQYYKGIKVENAGYTLHYDENGEVRFAHGKYVDVSNLDVVPVISKDDAAKAFAIYEGLSPNSITKSSAELIIKCIKGGKSKEVPLLVYKVLIETTQLYVTEYGYVDAKTGMVVKTESYLNHSAATGTFVTKYYGTKYATTNFDDGKYYLYDLTRGNGIRVKDLFNNKMDYLLGFLFASVVNDTDNYWNYSDYNDSTFMAFEVFWAFQKIYDRLYNVHGKNGIDNNGKLIKAYIKALTKKGNGYTTEGACWDNNQEKFFFGEGGVEFNRPLSSLDIVAHEYGHAITHYEIGWSHDEDFLNEGLSDIWGAIMDYRYGDANADVWKIGENIPNPEDRCCIRDLESPLAFTSYSQMADVYNSGLYSSFEHDNDSYGMSGPFSHWFYLLVNGGHGYNSEAQYYVLDSIGMDVAENLIVKAIYDNYLENTYTYQGVRDAFLAAANAMNVSGLTTAVRNAWFAVGVGNMAVSLSGPILTNSQSTYTVEGVPNGCYVAWSLTDNYYNQNCIDSLSYNQCRITRAQGHDMMDGTLTATIMYDGIPMQTLTKTGLCAYADFWGQYTSGNLSGTINYTHLLYATANTTTNIYSPNFIGGSVSYNSTGTTPLYWQFNPELGRLYFTMPPTNNNAPVVIDVDDVCGNHYQLYALPNNSPYYLNISNNEGCITIMLNENSDTSERTGIVDYPWTLEVRSATTGELKVLRSETSKSASVSTSGWPKGIYIVKATCGNEELTEKFVLK